MCWRYCESTVFLLARAQCILELFGLLMLWQTILAPSTKFPVGLLLLLNIIPLLIPMRGFLNGDKKVARGWHISVCFI